MQSSWPCESARSLCSMSKSLWCGLTQVHNNSMEHFLDVFEWCRLVVNCCCKLPIYNILYNLHVDHHDPVKKNK